MGVVKLQRIRWWCQKVLPLVYEESLSYYEQVCKLVEVTNQLIDNDNAFADELEKMDTDFTSFRQEMQQILNDLQNNVNNMATQAVKDAIDNLLKVGVYFGLTQDGHFCAYVQDSWSPYVTFNTTGYDINIPTQPEFGHLVLSY